MPNESHSFSRLLIALLVLLLLAVGVYAFSYFAPPVPRENAPVGNNSNLSESIRAGVAPRPPVATSTMIKSLERTKGFQALVSYTDLGFEPKEVTIKQDETIRFTNNSSHHLSLAAADTDQPYPTATEIAPQEFWEVTFTEVGDWGFTDNFDKSRKGVVHVK